MALFCRRPSAQSGIQDLGDNGTTRRWEHCGKTLRWVDARIQKISGLEMITFEDSFLWSHDKEAYQAWWPETAALKGHSKRS